MNCPSCGGAMRLEEDKEFLRCEFCKNIVFPEKNDDGVRVLVELSELSCPGCVVPLVHAALEVVHANLEGWRMLYCGKCRGMLVSADIFVELILDLHAHSDGSGAIPRAPDPKDLLRRTSCPKCHRQMDTHLRRPRQCDHRRLRILSPELAGLRRTATHCQRSGRNAL
jgi:hypothetical protein